MKVVFFFGFFFWFFFFFFFFFGEGEDGRVSLQYCKRIYSFCYLPMIIAFFDAR